MTNVVPSASPIWTRTADYSQFGGHIEKTNRLGVSSFNPKTDISAQQFSSIVDYLARMSWSTCFCTSKFSYTSTLVTFSKYLGQNGIGIVYAPTATVDGTDVTLVFNTTYTDSYNIEDGISLSIGQISPHGLITTIPYITILNSYTIKLSNIEESVEYGLTVW
jgi:deoxyribodipyrimidine photolyase-like uncharacterized protein